jgi:hypothetical protein
MKKDTMRQVMVISLFWGGLWGIAEASLGHLAHLVTVIPGVAGFIMFPVGFYFMTRAYKSTGKAAALLSTAAVAASIKLVDLFLPGLGPIKTINPAVCILMEALAVMAVFKLFSPGRVESGSFGFKEALTASAAWRLGFVVFAGLQFVLAVSAEFMQMGAAHILRFLLLESVVNAVIITGCLKLEKRFKWNKWVLADVRPVAAGAAVTAAVLFTVLL